MSHSGAEDDEEKQASTSAAAGVPAVRRSSSSSYQPKCCWVCFASEEDDESAVWLHPCRCKGSMKYVHENCLQRWIDEKQKGNIFNRVVCSQCNVAYLMVYPTVNSSLILLAKLDLYVNRASPWIAGSVVFGGFYWVSVTYGAITIMQMLGYRKAMHLMERTEPILLLILLPAIPIVLMTANLIRWDDRLAYYLYERSRIANEARRKGLPLSPMQPQRLNIDQSGSRFLCTALALPTASAFVGRLLFSAYTHWSTWRRHLLGAITYLTVKGVCSVYYRYSRLVQKHKRRILNYPSLAASGSQTTPEDFADAAAAQL